MRRFSVRAAPMRRSLAAIAMLGALGIMSGCSMNRRTDPSDEVKPVTILKVDNKAFSDMTVYVYRSAQRIRMGFATGGSTTKLVVPSSLLFGPTSLRFQADPVGGSRTPITEEITVSPGDEITLVIPP